MQTNKLAKRIVIILVVLMNIGCDQISKSMVRKNVSAEDYIPLIADNFILTNVENTGAMLGFGENLPPVLKLILLQALPVFVLLILLYRTLLKTYLNNILALAFSFVIGGGIGNIIDRIAYGSVTDFFLLKAGIFKTGIFNMADVSVTIGALFILYISLRYKNIEI